MAIKSAIKTAMQNALSLTSGLSTWTKLESYLHTQSDSILENLYNTTPLSDTNATTNVFTEVDTNIEYALTTQKQGAHFTLKGTIKNNTGSALSHSVNLVTITNGEYTPSAGYSFYGVSSSDDSNIKLAILANGTNTKMVLNSSLMSGETIIIDTVITVAQ